MFMAKIESINISTEKGTVKTPVPHAEINMEGIVGDAHSGDWHRQVSLLAKEDIDKFSVEYNSQFKFGDFAENITTSGIDLKKINLLDIIALNDVKLMVTQKGKKCHGGGCAIFNAVGHCVMPKDGVFARVLNTGKISVGDEIHVIPKTYKVLVITLSDRASKGIYEDLSGAELSKYIQNFFENSNRIVNFEKVVIPDDFFKLQDIISSHSREYDLIFTTGGTGVSQKDITIEAVKPLLSKEIPGIMEMVRMKYGQSNPKAMLSRSIAGTISRTLIFSLPGSVKAVKEYMQEICNVLDHLIYMINDLDVH